MFLLHKLRQIQSQWGKEHPQGQKYVYINQHQQQAVAFHCCAVCKQAELRPVTGQDVTQFCRKDEQKPSHGKAIVKEAPKSEQKPTSSEHKPSSERKMNLKDQSSTVYLWCG